MLLKTRLHNTIEKIAKEKGLFLKYDINNVSVNGIKKGCSGFITNTETGSCIYINTEHSCFGPISDKSMYRYAKDNKDYSSTSIINGNNRFCPDDFLAENVVKLLIEGKAIIKNK